ARLTTNVLPKPRGRFLDACLPPLFPTAVRKTPNNRPTYRDLTRSRMVGLVPLSGPRTCSNVRTRNMDLLNQEGGNVIPRALAVLTLTTSSTFVGCSIGASIW